METVANNTVPITDVVVLYRVVQHWRAPIFEKLNAYADMNIEVWHGPDFLDSKVVSTQEHFSFERRKLFSLKMSLKSKNGHIHMPFSPLLIFSLIRRKPDVVVCEGASNLINSIQAYVYCKLFKKRFVWWSLGKILNRTYDRKRGRIDSLIRCIERNSDGIISYSSRGKDYFRSIGVGEDKIFVAVNVIDTERTIASIEELSECGLRRVQQIRGAYSFVTLFVGALTLEKSIDKLLHAQRIVEDRGLNVLLLIVGGGSERTNLVELANSLELKNVLFSGPQHENVRDFFRAGDIFILPGLGGLAISEAMCYGLPVIASVGDGCEADLVTKRNGVIDSEVTPEKLAMYIEQYYVDRELVQVQGRESFRIVKDSLNVHNYVSQVRRAIHG